MNYYSAFGADFIGTSIYIASPMDEFLIGKKEIFF